MMESGIFYYREIGNAIREKDEQLDRFDVKVFHDETVGKWRVRLTDKSRTRSNTTGA